MPKVSVLLPVLIEHEWQRFMTECAVKTMYATTDVPFELVIVETLTQHFEGPADRYLHVPEKRLHGCQVGAGEAALVLSHSHAPTRAQLQGG